MIGGSRLDGGLESEGIDERTDGGRLHMRCGALSHR